MKKIQFEFITPLSRTRVYKGQLKVMGEYWMEEGSLMCDYTQVLYQYDNDELFIPIPAPFVDWLDVKSKIFNIAYEHCKYLMQQDQPDTTTDVGQDHYCQTNNKLD